MNTHEFPKVADTNWTMRGIVLNNGDKPCEEFLESAARGEKFIEWFRTVLTAQPFGEIGKRFKRLRHVQNVFEATVGQERMLGFRCRDTLIWTHGFSKKTDETPPEEIEHCLAIAKEYAEEVRGRCG